MGRWTQRQYVATLAWVDAQWNVPSRSDHYAMQVALAIYRVFAKKGKTFKLDDFKVKFETAKAAAATPALTREQQVAASKSRWLGMMTAPVKVVSK